MQGGDQAAVPTADGGVGRTVPAAVRLDVAVDVDALAAEALALPPHAWIPHFNLAVYDGEWSGAALRAPGGRVDRIYPDAAGAEPFAATPWLATCPAAAALLGRLPGILRSARLLRLGPGSTVREHHDPGLNLDHGEARLHVPVVSGPGVGFWLDGDPLDLRPGTVWYLDLDRPHRLTNTGATPRVHLVVDLLADDALRALVAGGSLVP